MASTQIIIMGGAALGGLWFPFDVHLNFAQRIGLFTPQYWALTVFQDIMLRWAHLSNVALNIFILLTFAVDGLFVALFRFKRYIISANS